MSPEITPCKTNRMKSWRRFFSRRNVLRLKTAKFHRYLRPFCGMCEIVPEINGCANGGRRRIVAGLGDMPVAGLRAHQNTQWNTAIRP